MVSPKMYGFYWPTLYFLCSFNLLLSDIHAVRQTKHITICIKATVLKLAWVSFLLFCSQALCILTNIANGKSAKDYIMGNDDLVGKIVSYLVCILYHHASFCIYLSVLLYALNFVAKWKIFGLGTDPILLLILLLFLLGYLIDIVWAVMIVWRIRGKIIRTVQCCTLYHSRTQLQAHTYEQFLGVY